MISSADKNDKKELKTLWQITFLEDPQITDLFFDSIFDTVVTPVIKIDDEIVSSLFLLPCKIGKYNGKCVYCAMTKYAHRGKGYMRKLLDFSYDYCKENGFDFLFLVPAESSLFDYYENCGFEKFGTSRIHIVNDTVPVKKDDLNHQYEIEFDSSVLKYWTQSCIVYGGETTDFGLVFDDEEVIIRNAKGNYCDIPEKYKKAGTVVQGNINFGEAYSPAMIKTEIENIKNLNCYIGITLE